MGHDFLTTANAHGRNLHEGDGHRSTSSVKGRHDFTLQQPALRSKRATRFPYDFTDMAIHAAARE